MTTMREEYRAMAKPRAIEEVGDIYLIRPLGFLIVQALRRTAVTPTMVSVMALLAGWATAWCYYRSNLAGVDLGMALLGMFLLLLHSALDSADGQLARVTNRTSPLGRIVDGFCDNLSFLAIYLAIVLSTWQRQGNHGLILFAMAVAAGYSHSVQSSLVEYQRSLYLYCVHGSRDITDADPGTTPEEGNSTGGTFAGMLNFLHTLYYRRQRSLLPSTARVERAVIETLKKSPERAPEIAARYARRQRPTMSGWAWMAANSHKAGVVLASFIPVVGGGFWSGLGMGWFLIYDLGLNVVMAGLMVRQAGVNRNSLADIAGTTVNGKHTG